MTVKVKYFAGLRERVGRSGDELQYVDGLTVAGVWQALSPNMEMPAHILAAVNHEHVDKDRVISDGDEVAFFPPVTGG